MVSAVDKEQIEMLTNFWKNYGKGILLAITLGLLVGLGWRYWQQRVQKHQAQASVIYQTLFNVVTLKNIPDAQNYTATLKSKFKDTPYASLAAMLLARLEVESNKYDQALGQLNWVIDNSKVKSFQQMARINAARILISQQQYDKATTLLHTVTDKTFQPLIDSVQGDLYFAAGNKAKAQQAYQAAKAGFEAANVNNPMIDMQLNSVY